MKYLLVLVLLVLAGFKSLAAHNYNVTAFGAVGDGIQMNTIAIQKAIDECAAGGGGKVIIPVGKFLTESIHLKSGVMLFLDKDALLLGSTKRSDYSRNASLALILAEFQHDIGITGSGTINGQGRELAADVVSAWKAGLLTDNKGKNRPDEKYRPGIIDFDDCQKVTVKGVTIKDASCWVQTYRRCKDLLIDDIKVISMAYWNNDGIDVVDCNQVEITNCDVNSADDGICLKSGDSTLLCQNVDIKKCRIRSSASAIKFGTASTGGFADIRIKNIYVYDTYRSAIALETVDGGILKNVFISNVYARNAGNAFFLRVGKRNTNNRRGSMENIKISNLTACIPYIKADKGYEFEGPVDTEKYNTLPSSIMGLPGNTIKNVSISHVTITYEGGPQKEIAAHKVPERTANYPEFSMFGELPAWGFYLRHVEGITFKDVKISCSKPDYRPPFAMDDAGAVQQKSVWVNNVPQKTL